MFKPIIVMALFNKNLVASFKTIFKISLVVLIMYKKKSRIF